jgi:hypothetical protein
MKHIAGWANTILLTTYQLGLPDKGLAILHIDTEGSNNNQQQTPELHYLVTLVQADGDWDLEHNRNYGDNTDFWRQPAYTQCTPETSPNTNWWSGAASNLYAKDISAAAPVMTFDFLDGPDCNYNYIPDQVDLANCDGSPWCQDCNGNGQLDECDVVQGISLDCNGNGWLDECDIAYGWSTDVNGNGVPDECERLVGDLNCDGTVDFGDIHPFVLLLTSYQLYVDTYPSCLPLNGDIDDDGQINFADINPFVALLSNP